MDVEKLLERIETARNAYHRLVVVAGPPGSGKTRLLRAVAERTGAPLLNLNLELSRRLLELDRRARALRVRRLLEELLEDTGAETVLLDNTEILFDPALKLNPLDLFRMLSRNRTLAVAWGGERRGDELVYARPGHPEYRRVPVEESLVADLSGRFL